MNRDSFIVYIKVNDIYKDIAEDVETRFDLSNYKLQRPFPNGKKRNWINERQTRWKNHDKVLWIKSKKNSYLIDDGSEDKKAKTQKSVL